MPASNDNAWACRKHNTGMTAAAQVVNRYELYLEAVHTSPSLRTNTIMRRDSFNAASPIIHIDLPSTPP